MTAVLDSGALSTLARRRTALHELLDRGLWPAQVPTVVLAESLTGDHRRDFHANWLLRRCQVRGVDEPCARDAARMRTATGRAGTISAVDAIVAAFAATRNDPVVVTTDAADLGALLAHAARSVDVAAI